MKIDTKTVQDIANLARIHIDENTQELQNAMNAILDMFEDIAIVDTTNIEPLSNPHDANAYLRDDEVKDIEDKDLYQNLAPKTENGFYLVPKVIE